MTRRLACFVGSNTRLINSPFLNGTMKQVFHVIIEQDEDGGYIGKVAELPACLSQGDSLDELMKNMKEAIELCLEVETQEQVNIDRENMKFVGVQEIQV